MAETRIHFIGGGQMVEAIIKAASNQETFPASLLSVTDLDKQRLQFLADHYGVQTGNGDNALEQADIVVLGIRPQDDLASVGRVVQQYARQNAIIVSLIAGVTISQLEKYTAGRFALARIIPNTLTDTGFGFSGVTFSEKARRQQVQEHAGLNQFLTSFGKVEYLDERLIDIFTGYSVAGPNYIYYFIESLADAGVLAGLSRQQAWRSALENIKGAAVMLEKSRLHPRQLLDINNSAGGVGIHALYELNNSDFAAALQRSVLAAVKRTRELGEAR